ncbi:MAG: hypothetical protein ACRDTJ_10140 [Pseudonocardiaceae bacterium]
MGVPDGVPDRRNHRTIPTTCQTHGTRGFCNLRVTKVNGEIELDPHVAGACVIRLDRTAAVQLFDLIGEWLGWTRPAVRSVLAAVIALADESPGLTDEQLRDRLVALGEQALRLAPGGSV